MNPLSKLILENADINMKVDIGDLWNNIWRLGYSRQMIADQVFALGLSDAPKYFNTVMGFPCSTKYSNISR